MYEKDWIRYCYSFICHCFRDFVDGYFAYITTGMGLVGLIMAIAGFVSKEDR